MFVALIMIYTTIKLDGCGNLVTTRQTFIITPVVTRVLTNLLFHEMIPWGWDKCSIRASQHWLFSWPSPLTGGFAPHSNNKVQYFPRNMHTVFALVCFVVVMHWLIFPYPSGLLHWHCGNLTIAPVPAKQPWWIWINTSCEFIMNDCITTTKQSTTKSCAYFLGYTVERSLRRCSYRAQPRHQPSNNQYLHDACSPLTLLGW